MIISSVKKLLCLTAFITGFGLTNIAFANEEPVESFGVWLNGFKKYALDQGISAKTLDAAFKDVAPIEKVLGYDRSQPEFTRTFWTYLNNGVSKARIERGKKLLVEHKELFARIYDKYGVQPRFLVSFWGLETNFGDYTGGMPVIGSLATLAHDPRRREFFTSELIHALRILDEGHITLDKMQGSWAGAMGQTQFMPSTFANYAVDGDGDGKKDIWGSLPDIFESSANYLSSVGWKGDETWGREVKLPKNFDLELMGMTTKKDLSNWQKIGLRRANGNNLPIADMQGSIVLPAGYQGPAFLVYGNYRAIMIWNRSHNYALTVGHLSDLLVGRSQLVAVKPAGDEPLSRAQVLGMQANLGALGFDAGKPDGIIGSMTRTAIRDYQRSVNLPADGYPTLDLIVKLDAVTQ